MNPPKKVWIRKSKKQRSLLFLAFLCFTCVTLVVVNGSLQEKSPSDIVPTTEDVKEKITKESLVPVPISPNAQTEFFSKEEGKALLYYSIVNDTVRFYAVQGKDPITGEDLLPVTQEIVDQYTKAVVKKKELAVSGAPSYSVSEVKIIKKEKKVIQPKKKKKPKRGSIWNTGITNSAFEDEISLFVFDENDRKDELLTQRLKEEFTKRKYFVTEDIIHADEMNNEIATHLKNSNIHYFEGNLKTYTDYICIGIASYSYGQNRYRNDLTDCTLQITYFIYDVATGEQVFGEQDKVVGSGQTKELARVETIKKFVL